MAGKKKRVPAVASAQPAPGPKRLRPLAHHVIDGDCLESKPVWSVALLDHDYDGEWSWRRCDHADYGDIFAFLREMERLSWREIESQMYRPLKSSARPKHHSHARETLCDEAQRRLVDLSLDDVDEVFRFRLGGTKRLWGVRLPQSKVFLLLWWDPEHKVYPVGN